MPIRLIAILIFLSTRTFGQTPKETLYLNTLGLTIIDSISSKDIIGNIYSSDGFAGFSIQLDSGMNFRKSNFYCVGSVDIDSGLWSIEKHGSLILKSKTGTLNFDAIKFDNYYFFVLETERKKFIDALIETREYIKKNNPLKIDNQKHSENYLIWYFLKRDFYTKQINTGT